MAWLTALTDVRTLIGDGPQDRYCYRKKLFGDIDGTNVRFKTFEFRRITDFTSSTDPLGIYFNGVLQPAAIVASDDLVTGELSLQSASAPNPATVQRIEATYFYHWFFDSELTTFLINASHWLGLSADFTQIPDGLIPSAQHYAAQDAFHKLSMRWAQRASETFLLEDAPKKEALGVAESYMKIAQDFKKKALDLRNDFYQRQGQPLAPNFLSSFGSVKQVTPRR